MIALSTENTTPLFLSNQPLLSFSFTALFYIFTLLLIYFQNVRLGRRACRYRSKMLFLANMELGFFFIVYFFIFAIHRFFLLENFLFSSSLSALVAILLYFGGLAIFNYTQNKLQFGKQQAFPRMVLQLFFLIPFMLPFLIYMLLSDVTALLPWNYLRQITGVVENSYEDSLIFMLSGLLFMILMIVTIPLAVVYFWKCKDLSDSSLKDRLVALCQKANFKFAGLKTWDVMHDSLTAAIIGVYSRFRYIIFTPSLLKQLSPNAVEAVLAHEIGHSKSKHLLFYPFIIFGILLAGAYLASIIFFQLMMFLRIYLELSFSVWDAVSSLIFFIIFAMILASLFRLFFGYFSRLFERQADLYVFELGVAPAYLIEALDEIGIASGHVHDAPNWHHYSIRQRMDFLQKVEKNPSLINVHRRKVLFSLLVYFVLLGGLSTIIFYNH